MAYNSEYELVLLTKTYNKEAFCLVVYIDLYKLTLTQILSKLKLFLDAELDQGKTTKL